MGKYPPCHAWKPTSEVNKSGFSAKTQSCCVLLDCLSTALNLVKFINATGILLVLRYGTHKLIRTIPKAFDLSLDEDGSASGEEVHVVGGDADGEAVVVDAE